MSPLDAWFLQLERASQQLHIGSALIFEGPIPAYEDLCAVVAARLEGVPRYRQRFRRVPLELGRPVWVDDVHFRVTHHVRHTALPAPGSDAQLRTLAGRLMSQPLDPERPLWETWLVEGLSENRWALINKAHHAMMDGVSGTDIMGVLLDRRRRARRPKAPSWRAAPEPSRGQLVASAVMDAVRSPADQVRAAAGAVAAPTRAVREVAAQLWGLAEMGGKAARLETVLDGPIGPHRSWEWARADLAEVKRIKNTCGGTVNDVFLAAITGGFRTLLQSRGENVAGRTIRTLVPVSVRRPHEHGTLGNQVSAVFADLPVGIADPAQRLAAVTAQLSSLKGRGMAIGVESMLEAAELFPPTVFALAARLAARMPQRSISTVTTNVPGPQVPMYLLGSRMLEIFPYIPLAVSLRITIGIMSYDGRVSFGITGEADRVPDLHVLSEGIEAAMTELA
jgi:WS/DGAT/MGAT family acyltransferase